MNFRQIILNHIPADRWVKGQDLCRMAGVTEPYSSSSRKLAKMVGEGILKAIPFARGSFFALPDAPSCEGEMQKRLVLNTLAQDVGRSEKRIVKMAVSVPIERVREILAEWVEAGYVDEYVGAYSLKTLYRLIERPRFHLILELDTWTDTWQGLNALFVKMVSRSTVALREPYEFAR